MSFNQRLVGAVDLADSVGIVTGAASGIGLATARAAARLGAKLTIADVDSDGLSRTAEELTAEGFEVLSVGCNITEERDLEELVAAAESLGPLDFAINVAGIANISPMVVDSDADGWRRTIDVNLTGTFLSMKHELRAFARHDRPGSIVNFSSSVGANLAIPGLAAYCASKAGVVMLSKCAALEVAATGVRVNVVAPGATETPMNATTFTPEIRRAITTQHPLGRFADADEIAAAAIWLASKTSSYVTGTVLTVDGGFAAGTAQSLDPDSASVSR